MDEQQCIFRAPGVIRSLAKRTQQQRRGKFPVAQNATGLIKILKGPQGDKEWDDEYEDYQEQSPSEAGAQRHFSVTPSPAPEVTTGTLARVARGATGKV